MARKDPFAPTRKKIESAGVALQKLALKELGDNVVLAKMAMWEGLRLLEVRKVKGMKNVERDGELKQEVL